VILGFVLVITSVSAVVFRYSLTAGNGLVAIVGVLFLVVGLVILITEIVEGWLSCSQSALVDGLQAG
jgi:hypothetical protein